MIMFPILNVDATKSKKWKNNATKKVNIVGIQENCHTHTHPGHTPGNPPSQLWKESLYSLLVKVARGVFQS